MHLGSDQLFDYLLETDTDVMRKTVKKLNRNDYNKTEISLTAEKG